MRRERVSRELRQVLVVVTRREELEIAEAKKRRRDATDDGAGFVPRVAVVEQVAQHVFPGRDEAERTRRRNTEVVHGLAAQKFPQRRAQYRAAVGASRIRRGSSTFELQLPVLTARVSELTETDGASVAELARPATELMPAVASGHGIHSRQRAVAGEDFGELGARRKLRRKIQKLGDFARHGERAGRLDRRRPHARETGTEHLARAILLVRVERQRGPGAVRKLELHRGLVA